MNAALDDLAIARVPRQARAKARFEAVLVEAEKLLVDEGLSGFSIPELARRLGYTRASIYKFFPSPYAVLNELTHRELQALESRLAQRTDELRELRWREMIAAVVAEGCAFYNERPVARLLILGGAVTDSSFRALEFAIRRLGALARRVMLARGVRVPDAPPDIATVAVEICASCLRISQFNHGRILDAYRDEAARAMCAYLAAHVDGRSAP